jgi:hypothetical protein
MKSIGLFRFFARPSVQNMGSAFTNTGLILLLLHASVQILGQTKKISSVVNEWRYEKSRDPLTDQSSIHAAIKSRNLVEFHFPYNGGTSGTLIVRKNEDGRPEVLFAINRGQLLCPRDTCIFRYRFDDLPVGEYGASPSDNGNPRVMFLGYYSADFLENLKKAKRLRVSTDFYQEGPRTFEFAPAGIDLEKIE